MSIVATDYFNQVALGNLTTTGSVLNTVTCGLFTSAPTLTNETLLSDLTEATYEGYERQAVTWLSIFQQPDESMALQGSLLDFTPSSSISTSNTIQGYFVVVTDDDTSTLLFAETLAEPVAISDALSAVMISPQVSFGPSSTLGAATVID